MPTITPLQAGDHRRVGRYRLTGRIDGDTRADDTGERVFLGKMVDGDPVIVTLLPRARVADAAARDRFSAEAHVARRVAPFCAARILDAGIEGDDPYVVTEYVPGSSLAEVAGQEGPLPDPTLEILAIATATGLTAIHQTGLVHGEFGPDHVVLGPEGPWVTHFGITPPYGAATPAADMLAWAVTIMFAALGRLPVGPQDLAALPGELRAVVSACLTPDPSVRPAAQTVLAELLSHHDLSGGLLTEGARQARAAARIPVSPPSRRQEHAPRRSPSRAFMWAAACAACLIAIAAAVAYITHQHRSPGPAVTATGSPPTRSAGLPQPLPAASVPASLAGTWSGVVHQTNPVLSVTVRLSLPAGAATGTIAYPALGCSGNVAIAAIATGRLTLDQTIGAGRKTCTNGVITLALRPDGSMAFTFLRSQGSSPQGTLTRRA